METMLVINRDLLTCDHGLQGIQTFFRAEAVIRIAALDKLFRIFHINACLASLALNVRSYSAVLVRSLVKIESRMRQCFVDDIQSTLIETLLIGVLDAEHKTAAGMFCNEV